METHLITFYPIFNKKLVGLTFKLMMQAFIEFGNKDSVDYDSFSAWFLKFINQK
jgi:hypothetical protein